MALTIIGEHPLAKDANSRLHSRIGTVFPSTRTVVTLPGIHATQRLAYTDHLNEERQRAGQAPLTEDEQMALWENSADLIMEDSMILIRPDPTRMDLVFAADELLQELTPKQHIKFLHVLDERVRDAIKRRGECWRISPMPRTAEQMKEMIATSKIAIGGREIYYYTRTEGTRWLTCAEFAGLASLDDNALRLHLTEIQINSARHNRFGRPEVQFFMTGKALGTSDMTGLDFNTLPAADLRTAHRQLTEKFRAAVAPELQKDDIENLAWRNRMFAALIGRRDEVVSEEILLGLSEEFFMQVEWLPGVHVEEGELIFDDVCDLENVADNPDLAHLCDDKVRGFIFNFVREYGDLEYINVGRVVASLSRRTAIRGRRGVYVAVIKPHNAPHEVVRIIRMQKWGVRELLDEGKDLLDSILQAEEYTDYILDRRLGCRQLGMHVLSQISSARVHEHYLSHRPELNGLPIWSTYFVRNYVRGVASDKMPPSKLADQTYAMRFAHLLGKAAAPNLILGRCDNVNRPMFDDGDEVVIEDARGIPADISVSDHTGTFADYATELAAFAADYARPVNRRAPHLADPAAFAETYLAAFEEEFVRIQREYRKRKRAFDALFRHRPRDEAGSFAYRWEQVLARLDRTDPQALVAQIRAAITGLKTTA